MVSEERPSVGSDRVPPSQAIVEAVADAKGVDPFDLGPPDYEPLYAVVDLEALDSLFAGRESAGLRVDFTYEGCEVTVRAGGRVDVSPSASNDPAGTSIDD